MRARRTISLCIALAFLLPAALGHARKRTLKRRIKKHHISVTNVSTGERVRNLKLIRQDPNNRSLKYIRPEARKRLARLFRDRKTGRRPRLPDRLLWYLYIVGYHYDRPVQLVSGMRARARRTSRHHKGHAADIRIEGVSPKALWRYVKRFKKVGLGWYPTSKFVHIDVRDKSYYWIDDSGPGQDPRYRKNVRQPTQEWRDQRRRKRRIAAR